jgi:hypothetical protein
MGRLPVFGVFTVVLLFALFAAGAFAHPASGIVVDTNGDVFFIDTGHGVCKIDAQGKLTYIHAVSGGGHFLALDAKRKFPARAYPQLFKRITPVGVEPAILFASGGAPFVVNHDGNLYYGSGYPGGEDTAPAGLTVTRMTPNGQRALFAPTLKVDLAKMNEAVTGLAAGSDGSLYVACPSAILNVKMDGTVTTLVHPVLVKDCDNYVGADARSPFYHAPYLRGLDVTAEGTIYAAVTGCRCVVKITPDGKVESILKAERPWTPTGVALHDGAVYVLEYTNGNDGPDKGWRPRVRKLDRDGKVTTLATVTRGST